MCVCVCVTLMADDSLKVPPGVFGDGGSLPDIGLFT
jgi:hypothetical protein